MNFKKNGGFTLVELIVVIAILGILAGIGIPQYSKYVEKTQIAVEEQNINMFHNAFVVACVSNGEDPATYPININWDSTGTIFMGLNEVTSFSLADEGSTVEGDFNAFFGFPTTTYEFKKLSSKVENGIRNGIDAEGGTPTYDGGKYTSAFEAVKDQIAGSVSTFQNSNFNKVGATELMGKVDTVTGIASEIFKAGGDLSAGLLNSVMSDPSGLYAYFGLTGEDATMENLQKKMSGLTQQENADLMANYAVLQAAKNTTSTQASGWLSDLKTNAADPNKNLVDSADIKSMMSSTDTTTAQTGMSKAAMMYAMYTAYAQTLEGDAKAEAEANTKDIGSFISNVNTDAGFRDYLQTDAATTDMNGYLAALDIINKSTANNTDATNDLLGNGFGDGNLSVALEDLLKQQN